MIKNSIEEDIKIVEEFKTNGYNILLMKYGDRIKTNFKLEKAIEHILSDYKRVLKENEQLRTEVNSLKKENEKALAEYMEWQKQELEQKDKIIDLMAEDIDGFQMECNRYFKDKEEVKQYFINKAKEIR